MGRIRHLRLYRALTEEMGVNPQELGMLLGEKEAPADGGSDPAGTETRRRRRKSSSAGKKSRSS